MTPPEKEIKKVTSSFVRDKKSFLNSLGKSLFSKKVLRATKKRAKLSILLRISSGSQEVVFPPKRMPKDIPNESVIIKRKDKTEELIFINLKVFKREFTKIIRRDVEMTVEALMFGKSM